MKKNVILIAVLLGILFIIVCISAFIVYSDYSFTTTSPQYYFSNTEYCWPLPGYYTISSLFGERIVPTTGASSYHSGIDISAPEGSYICAASSGIVSYLDFERSQWVYIKN